MINVKNGDLSINDKKFIIRHNLTNEEFENSCLYKDVLREQKFSYKNYFLRRQPIGDRWFVMTLYFNDRDILEITKIAFAESPTSANTSESYQLEKKKKHDEWLISNLGKPPYKYPWGSIFSNYDSRSGFSVITIKYNVE